MKEPDESRSLREFDAISPADVLARLARAEPGMDGTRPDVEILLKSGQMLNGYPLKVGGRSEEPMLLLFEGYQQKGPRTSSAVVWVELAAVSAVRFRDPLRYANELSSGSLDSTECGDPLTRLEARRKVTALWEGQTPGPSLQIAWESLPDEGIENSVLVSLVDFTLAALRAISSERLGKEALAAIAELRIQFDADFAGHEYSRNGSSLELKTGLRGRSFKPDDLRRRLETAL